MKYHVNTPKIPAVALFYRRGAVLLLLYALASPSHFKGKQVYIATYYGAHPLGMALVNGLIRLGVTVFKVMHAEHREQREG